MDFTAKSTPESLKFRTKTSNTRTSDNVNPSSVNDDRNLCYKKPNQDEGPLGFHVPPLFLAPLRMIRPSKQESFFEENVVEDSRMQEEINLDGDRHNNINGECGNSNNQLVVPVVRGCKQFWKAGDYESNEVDSTPPGVLMDHVRVHPKFLHSNATSHKWALGAFAELLDNALDEVVHGATFVNVDVLKNEKDDNPMILVEDNGGGMTPDKMRQCMSLGYSAKSKMANTIGQYGNGFKTSTMRLGADVIVFSRCNGQDGISETQSIGLLSYTYLTSTGKEDIVVPMVDFQKSEQGWEKIIHSNLNDWEMKLRTILQWSPFFSEDALMEQLDLLKDQGTRIIIYNLWEDEENELELDFDTDPLDIQLRGVNRDEKNIQMAEQYRYSRHFLTYKHSMRSYASILYLTRPTGFRIILRGEDVEHHYLDDDIMLGRDIYYRPQYLRNKEGSDQDCAARGKLGFVKDAHHHIDVQGFNVYHKNRLIKPFWRVWNPAGSDGRGVIGYLEANFVEPAHDKQGFERTSALSRLEDRLIDLQKSYWSSNCQEIGYAARRSLKKRKNISSNEDNTSPARNKPFSCSVQNEQGSTTMNTRFSQNNAKRGNAPESAANVRMTSSSNAGISTADNNANILFRHSERTFHNSGTNQRNQGIGLPHSKEIKKELFTNDHVVENSHGLEDDLVFREKRTEEEKMNRLLKDLEVERERSQKLETQLSEKTKELEEAKKQLDEAKKSADTLNKDYLTFIDMLSEERQNWTEIETDLSKKLRAASQTIEELTERVQQLESGLPIRSCKIEEI